jgi:RND superfamily putative drug exporter
MANRLSPEGLARSSGRHPWLTIGIWIVVLAVGLSFTQLWLADGLNSAMTMSTKPQSITGLDRLEAAGLNGAGSVGETVIVQSTNGQTVADPAFKAKVTAVTNDLRALVKSWEPTDFKPDPTEPIVTNYYEVAALGLPQAQAMVSRDKTTALIPVNFPKDMVAKVDMSTFLQHIETLRGNDFKVLTVGTLSFNERTTEIAQKDLVRGESIGIPLALIVLVLVFGALVAAGLPIVLALFSIGIALGITALTTQVYTLNVFIENMITMIGLAVGIDYALFVVERYREERRLGNVKQRAIERAAATAGKAVLFSGTTVVFSLAGVCLIPTNVFRSLGLGAIFVVIVAVAATLTLLPALLSLLGDRINWPRQSAQKRAMNPALAHEVDAYTGFFGRTTRLVMARPVVSLVLVGALLLAATVPQLGINTGTSGPGALPKSDVRDGYNILVQDFSAGMLSPVKIVLGGPKAQTEPAIGKLTGTMRSSGRFLSINPPVWSADNQTALVTAVMKDPANSNAAYDTVKWLRSDALPPALQGTAGTQFWVAGDAAMNQDFLALTASWTPYVFAFVLILSFLLLMVAFRSIVVPLKAIVLNLLSVGASYGIMVLVFQHGIGHDLFGFAHTPIIEAWIPILLFSILFGLSMDYEVFLLSRIREHYDLTGNNRESVAVGLRSTTKIIIGAALIMVFVFAGFATGSLVMLQQIGFGLAVAILIDATLVRSVLVPATMTLLGDKNWYLPRWLRWLPDIRVEGELPKVTAEPEHLPSAAPAD